ncbi:MAG: glycoside hydrolase family 65, partial [Lachnospiraceae bacterium]|nr:glycoside hydrolase family 65 [Lachnospiraceae bacterium]
MAINRQELVTRHNPVLKQVDFDSPLTVGNGELGYTADVTGMQTFYEEYSEVLPLCTQSQWGWHTKPVSAERYEYTLKDLVMTEYDYNGRTVGYPKKKMPGNEEVYDWLRQNPHRLNLAKIGF